MNHIETLTQTYYFKTYYSLQVNKDDKVKDKWIYNLSSKPLTNAEMSLL